MGGCRNWSRRSGPRNLDQIWTKSGPNLDTIWTGFLKMDAEFPDKILRLRTRESLLKIVGNKKVCKIPYVEHSSCIGSSTTNKMSRAALPQAALPSLSPWVEQRCHQIMAPPLPNAMRRPRAVGLALAVQRSLGGRNERHQKIERGGVPWP